MGTKPQTRVYATVSGTKMELFFVRDTTPGNLAITLRAPKFFEEEFATKYSAMKNFKMTVHVSSESTGNSLTAQIDLERGDIIQNRAHVDVENDGLLHHVFSRRFPDFRGGDFTLAARSKDSCIECARFEGDRNNLVCTVVASRPDLVSDHILEQRKALRLRFRAFELLVFPAFLHMVPLPQGDSAYPRTSLNVSGEPIDESKWFPAKSVEPENLLAHVAEYEEFIITRFKHRIIADMMLGGTFGSDLHRRIIAAVSKIHLEPAKYREQLI